MPNCGSHWLLRGSALGGALLMLALLPASATTLNHGMPLTLQQSPPDALLDVVEGHARSAVVRYAMTERVQYNGDDWFMAIAAATQSVQTLLVASGARGYGFQELDAGYAVQYDEFKIGRNRNRLYDDGADSFLSRLFGWE